jgi:hypothetical protein
MKDYYPDVTFEDGVFRFDLPNGDEFVIVPPKQQELSDDEILSLWHDWGQMITIDQQRLSFARAILKKASEKCTGTTE